MCDLFCNDPAIPAKAANHLALENYPGFKKAFARKFALIRILNDQFQIRNWNIGSFCMQRWVIAP